MKINRAPVLTLWAAVVAEELGYPEDTALTLGKALAGLNAQSKGQRLGIFEPSDEHLTKEDNLNKQELAPEHQTVRLLGREISVKKTDQGLRADAGGQVIDPGSVQKYLEQKFKDNLSEVLCWLLAASIGYFGVLDAIFVTLLAFYPQRHS